MNARSTLGIVAGLGVCVIVLLGAGVLGVLTIGDVDAAVPAEASALPKSSTTLTPARLTTTGIDLGTVMVPTPPGFDQIPDARLVVGGSADIERLVSERSDKDRSRAVFTETGLIDGYVRAWQQPSTSELVTVRLYQFNDDDGARSYVARVTTAMSASPATKFSVPATTDAVGIDTQVVQGANRLVFVVGRRGRVVAAIAATVLAGPDFGFLAPLARSQLSLLP